MRVVVTGGSGHIGREVVRQFRQAGHDVVAADVKISPNEAETPTTLVDLCNRQQVGEILAGADAVIHLGNHPGFKESGSAIGYANNVQATYNVFEAAEQAGVNLIVQASSIHVYGAFAPMHEGKMSRMVPHYLPLDENHPMIPAHPYAMSKAAGEWLADSFVRRRESLRVWSLRFTWVWSKTPLESRGFERVVIGSLATGIHISDAARACLLCCNTPSTGHTALNIVAPESVVPWSKQSLIDLFGVLPPFREALTPNQALISGRRAREVIGFDPQEGAGQHRAAS